MSVHGNVKCDCGDVAKDHYQGWGWCSKCGCTWYWPNVRYVKKQQEKKKRVQINTA